MKKSLILSACILSSLISGCGEPEVRYIKTPCPEMQTWKVAPLDANVTYEVYDENG
jgi:hypothetical protein